MTPSEQARADAIADAETLRLASDPNARITAEEAYRLGGWAIYWLFSPASYELRDPDEAAIQTAVVAASAAFRAVPGLRGDK